MKIVDEPQVHTYSQVMNETWTGNYIGEGPPWGALYEVKAQHKAL